MKKIRLKHSVHIYIIGLLMVIGILTGGVYVIDLFSEESQVEKIANRIERFKEQYGRLPNTEDREEMLSLGFELRVGWYPDFIILNNSDYELWLYYGFDGPDMVYNSKTKTWREEY